MPDTKISALPAATTVSNADDTVIVQAGVNKKAARTLLLTAAVGETIGLVGPGGDLIECQGAGGIAIQCLIGESIILGDGSTAFLNCFAGQIQMQTTLGQPYAVTVNGASIVIDATGAIQITPLPGTVLTLHYTPLTPGDWSGSPTSVWEALDRIAAVVSTGGATPIP